MKTKHRRRRCQNCKQLFLSDPRNRHHQRFCSDPACQKTSKVESQQRWRAKPENQHYWSGRERVDKVRAWRKKHPQYWKNGAAKQAGSTLQDYCLAQQHSPEPIKPDLTTGPLQDFCSTQG
jgi:hypothetical protein